MNSIPLTAGVDISKAGLDVALCPAGPSAHFTNDDDGLRACLAWLRRNGARRVAYEPTGPFHKPFERTLQRHGLTLVKVNPRSARRFAQATGTLAKTDRVDAAMLARMAATLDLPPTTLPEPDIARLHELLTARRGAMRDLLAYRNRLDHANDALLKRQHKRMIASLERNIAAIEAAADAIIAANDALDQRLRRLLTIPGIGRRTAVALIAEMPELGTLSGKAAASLAGLAPIANDSGLKTGRRFIRGGRRAVRNALYMAALATARSGAAFRAKYKALRDAGKPTKVAVVALMRKLLVIASAILRDQTTWQHAKT